MGAQASRQRSLETAKCTAGAASGHGPARARCRERLPTVPELRSQGWPRTRVQPRTRTPPSSPAHPETPQGEVPPSQRVCALHEHPQNVPAVQHGASRLVNISTAGMISSSAARPDFPSLAGKGTGVQESTLWTRKPRVNEDVLQPPRTRRTLQDPRCVRLHLGRGPATP